MGTLRLGPGGQDEGSPVQTRGMNPQPRNPVTACLARCSQFLPGREAWVESRNHGQVRLQGRRRGGAGHAPDICVCTLGCCFHRTYSVAVREQLGLLGVILSRSLLAGVGRRVKHG